jgi:FixJ family two-component response regulator
MIIFIDDEKRRMSSYAEEIESALSQEVHFEVDVDSAIEFFETQDLGEIGLIILDVMMPAGKAFASKQTEFGLKTGLLLYQRIRALTQSTPIVIFTNASDVKLSEDIIKDRKCIFLQKEDFLPSELSDRLKTFLEM